jgi:hypothetical protein
MRRLALIASTLVLAYSSLWACAPAASMRAPVPMGDLSNEVGLAGTWSQVLNETASSGNELVPYVSGVSGQLWYQHQFGEMITVGGTVFGGQTNFAGGGIQLRGMWVRAPRFRLGTDLEGGWLWGAVGIPVAVGLTEDAWLYTNPSLRLSTRQLVRLPLGIAGTLGDRWVLQAELSYGLDPTYTPLNQELTGSMGVAFRF